MTEQAQTYSFSAQIDERDTRGTAKSVSLFIHDQVQKVGRYQVRYQASGGFDVYYCAISNGSFLGPKKLTKADAADAADPALATIVRDLAKRGISIRQLADPGSSLEDLVREP